MKSCLVQPYDSKNLIQTKVVQNKMTQYLPENALKYVRVKTKSNVEMQCKITVAAEY